MSQPLSDEGYELDRLKAFSDGVYAIVVTLLVLDLRPPEFDDGITSRQFWIALIPLLPKFVSYLITFLVAGLMWIIHTRLFRNIRGYDRGLLWLNILALLFISLMPFTAGLLGQLPDLPATTALYAINLGCCGLCHAAIWRRAVRRGFTNEEITPPIARYIGQRTMVVPAVFAVIALLSLAGIPYALSIGWLIPVIMSVVHRQALKDLAAEPMPE